jgi:uncharacterized membrane protein
MRIPPGGGLTITAMLYYCNAVDPFHRNRDEPVNLFIRVLVFVAGMVLFIKGLRFISKGTVQYPDFNLAFLYGTLGIGIGLGLLFVVFFRWRGRRR